MFSVKKLFKISVFLLFLAVSALFILYLNVKNDLPSVDSLKEVKWQTPMQIFSAEGELISQFGEKKRIPLTLAQIPQQLINALLATEDERFYQHFGIDPIGLSRAIFGQIIGRNLGGGGTITMQVARNFFLTREQTYIRKLKEIFISFHIESLLTKDEILALYINKIELGHRAFGFGAAAQVYYGKDVNELTLAQIAVLAGLPKAPSTLNPISSPERARGRRAVVLQRMLTEHYITAAEFNEANNAPITATKHGAEIQLNAPYVAEMAHQEMVARYGKDEAYTGGYKVFTTVRSRLQVAAQHAVVENLLHYDQRHGYRGPVLSLRPTDNSEDNDNGATEKFANVINTQNQNILDSELLATLQSLPGYHDLTPAIVTAMTAQSATITLLAGQDLRQSSIPWTGMSWARAFINDQRQGPEPQFAKDILQYGDVIYVQAIDENSYRLSQLPQASAALVALSPDDGAIEAAVGGFSFEQSQYNRVTQAKRQVGSNIKPFIYSAAVEHGFTLASIINDAPINQWDRSTGFVWRPKNSPPTYVGPIRMRLALAQSKNVISVRLLREVGLDSLIDHLSKFGFDPNELPKNESLALGSASLTPLELVTGFATFANGGFLVNPYLISHIEDSFGRLLFKENPAIACEKCEQQNESANTTESAISASHDQSSGENSIENMDELSTNALTAEIETVTHKPVDEIIKAPRVISAQNAFLITEALNSAIWGADWADAHPWQGTGHNARSLKRRDIAGKTGTTNEAKDAWFSGFSRRMVATSWIGFDDHQRNLGQTRYNANLPKNQTTGKEAGAKSAQPAWIAFMQTALTELTAEPFEQPEAIVSVRIDKTTGKLTGKTDRSGLFEYFINGTEPTEYVTQDNSGEILDGKEKITEEIF